MELRREAPQLHFRFCLAHLSPECLYSREKNDVSLAYIIFLLEIGYDKKNAVAMANRDRDANHLFDFYFSDRLTAR